MSYQIIDSYTNKVIGTYETQAKAERAESHLVHEPNETRYEIKAPAKPKAKAKKTE
jgi:hypothetical protein